jgi:hypothetical protein
VRRSWFVVAAFELPKADIVNDQEGGPAPPFHPPFIGAIGQPRVQVVDEVDAAGIADPSTPARRP